MSKTIFLILAFLFLAAEQVFPHDAWIEPKADHLVIVYGHIGKLEGYDPAKVKQVRALDCKGAGVPLQTTKNKDSVTMSSKRAPAVATMLFDNGCWVSTTDGWKNLTKREAAGKFQVAEAMKSRKYAKTLLAPCGSFSKAVGLRFEIVPQKDPLGLKPGEALPVKVLLDGKAFEGAEVRGTGVGHDAKNVPKTDKDGIASVVIEKNGLQVINAAYKIPLKNDPDADVLSLSTNLVFGVK